MARPDKVAVVEEIKERLTKVQGAVLTDYRGLDVAEVTELRKQLREAGVEYKVLKNTLTIRAAREAGIDGIVPLLAGPTAIAFGYEDPVVAAKIINDFSKTHADLQVKGGLLEGKVLDVDGVKSLAELPPREILLAQVAQVMQAPIVGMVNVLQGNIRNFVYALDAIRQKKEEEAGA